MFKKFVKIPGESAEERYARYIEHQRTAWRAGYEREMAERASKTNFTDLFSVESSKTNNK